MEQERSRRKRGRRGRKGRGKERKCLRRKDVAQRPNQGWKKKRHCNVENSNGHRISELGSELG